MTEGCGLGALLGARPRAGDDAADLVSAWKQAAEPLCSCGSCRVFLDGRFVPATREALAELALTAGLDATARDHSELIRDPARRQRTGQWIEGIDEPEEADDDEPR